MTSTGSVWALDMSGTLVLDYNVNRIMTTIRNTTNATCYLSNISGVTTGSGYPLLYNEEFRNSDFLGSIFAYISGASCYLLYHEETI
jgi:hypothetical protein